jgi:hypothetical protein
MLSVTSLGCSGPDESSGTDVARNTPVCVPTGPGHTRIVKNASGFALTRDGLPYYIRGIAGQARIDAAPQYRANSTRTYSSGNATSVLDSANRQCMTVMLGIDLSKDPAQYTNPSYLNNKRNEVSGLLNRVKDHPALLAWALGNEIDLRVDSQAAWQFVGELAQRIHDQDPNHPVITVLSGSGATTIDRVVRWAPAVDALGINSYDAVMTTDSDIAASNFAGAYIVTEWGPSGHLEAPQTEWGRPIEPTSAEKARAYQVRYDYIFSHRDRALGSYVFFWGQKQERTPTWYSMFLESSTQLGLAGESCPTVDAMAFAWSGVFPSNRAPEVTGLSLDQKSAGDNVELSAGQRTQAHVTATDPDADVLSFIWEILHEPTRLSSGGAYEPRPERVGVPQEGTSPTLSITAPSVSGEYRLFVYVLDQKGHAGTANVPFRVN